MLSAKTAIALSVTQARKKLSTVFWRTIKKEIIDSILENYPIEIENEPPPPQTEDKKPSLKTAPKNDEPFEETAEKGLKCSPKKSGTEVSKK